VVCRLGLFGSAPWGRKGGCGVAAAIVGLLATAPSVVTAVGVLVWSGTVGKIEDGWRGGVGRGAGVELEAVAVIVVVVVVALVEGEGRSETGVVAELLRLSSSSCVCMRVCVRVCVRVYMTSA